MFFYCELFGKSWKVDLNESQLGKVQMKTPSKEPRFLQEVSLSSCFGWTQGLAVNSKPIYEVCDFKSEKSTLIFCFKGTPLSYRGSPLSTIFGTWKKFILVESVFSSTNFHQSPPLVQPQCTTISDVMLHPLSAMEPKSF